MYRMFVAPLFVAALILCGCASSGDKPTQKELAKQDWANARAGVLYSLASNQYSTGNFDACRKSLDEAAALNPKSVPIHLLSARLSIEQGRLELAEKGLEAVRALDPKSAEADYLSGIVYQRWQRPETALQFYASACEKGPAEPAYLLARAEMLVALDRRADAMSCLLEKLAYFEHSPYIRDFVGQLLVQERKYADAAKVLRQASILAPEDAGIREHLALALYWSGDFREAALVFGRLVKEERCARRYDLHAAYGECEFQAGRFAEARDAFQVAADLQPASPAAWLSYAKAALALDDVPRADISTRKALSLNPDSSEAHLMLGYVRLKQERFDDALLAFGKASELNPHDTVALCMCGYVMEKKNRPADAMGYYARALKINPRDELAATLMSQARVED